MLIRKSGEADFAAMLAIINDAAQVYRGVIPADRWHEPYMPRDDLSGEIAQGVVFWVTEREKRLSGVMGIEKPILIGTWAAASWAIEFYRRNGFTMVSSGDKDRLLRKYWSIPPRQIETSVVLVNARWLAAQPGFASPG